MSIYDHDFDEFIHQMHVVTDNLKKMNAAQKEMRWQFGDSEVFEEFVREISEAADGWISSHC